MPSLMTRQEIIRFAIAELAHRPVTDVKSTSRLDEDLGVRAIGRIELAVMLERRLGSAVRDDQIAAARTVADLERKLGA